jgi:hypothetical protein
VWKALRVISDTIPVKLFVMVGGMKRYGHIMLSLRGFDATPEGFVSPLASWRRRTATGCR